MLLVGGAGRVTSWVAFGPVGARPCPGSRQGRSSLVALCLATSSWEMMAAGDPQPHRLVWGTARPATTGHC